MFVPIFKAVTHLPPFMGVMLGLGVLWVVTEVIHMQHGVDQRGDLMVTSVLRRIDMPSVLFFLGILVAVAGLQVAGHLTLLASELDKNLGNIYLINGVIGVLSSIVDNVPLVAAAMGMYPMSQYPPDHLFWELLALCAGTGGSLLIIGSAAGGCHGHHADRLHLVYPQDAVPSLAGLPGWHDHLLADVGLNTHPRGIEEKC